MDGLSFDSDLDFSSPAEPTESKADDLDFSLSLADSSDNELDLGADLADFSLDLDAPAKPEAAAEDDFLLSLDDEPSAAPTEPSFDLPAEEVGGDFDLSADFDLSLRTRRLVSHRMIALLLNWTRSARSWTLLSDDLEQPTDLDVPVSAASASAALDNDDDFDFLSGTDETATKLDLARAYIDMG